MNRAASLPYWYMLTGAFCFSWMGFLAHLLSDTYPWQVIALVRTALALVIAAAITWSVKAPFAVWRPATLWLRSLSGSCSLVLTFYALTHTRSLAEVLVLTNMFPVWVALLSWPVLGTWPRWDTWLAIVVGAAGVIVMQKPGSGPLDSSLLAAALASLTTSIAMLGLHRLKYLHPSAIVTHFSAVSVLFCLAAMWIFPLHTKAPRTPFPPRVEARATVEWETAQHVDSQEWPIPPWLLLMGVGIAATFGQIYLTKAFAAGVPARVSVVGLSQVGFTALADTLFFGRSFQLHTLLGMLLIIAPTIWLLLRGKAERASPLTKVDNVAPTID